MPCSGTRKCSNCQTFFKPNPRSKGRQHFCSHPECRKASKRASQKKWLDKPDNRDHFRGSANVLRVQRWRANNPGYWKRTIITGQPKFVQQSTGTELPLQETLITQSIENKEEINVLKQDALQGFFISQEFVFIGLFAHLKGLALQDSIVKTGQEMQELGEHFLHPSNLKKGDCDVISSITQSTATAPNPLTIQLDRSPSGT